MFGEKITSNKMIRLMAWALLITIVFNLIYTYYLRLSIDHYVEDYQNQQNTAINIADLFISEKFESIYDDLNIIRNSNEFSLYKSSLEDEYALSEVESLFKRYASNKNGITQVRLLSAEGMELVRVNKVDDQVVRVPKSELQDKSDRYYYLHALGATENQIYVSDFDLNIENGVIVVPYEPTIRFTLKVNDATGKLIGLIVLNFDGEKFFSVISRYENLDISDIEIGILDYNNYWSLSDAMENDYLDISLTVKSNQSDEMRSIFDEIVQKQGAPKQGDFNLENKYYQYKEISEIEENKYLFEGKLFSWYFVSYFNIDQLIEHDHPFIHSNLLVQMTASIFVFIISYALIYLVGQKRRQNILMLTSAYITNNTHEGILLLGKNKEILYCNTVFEDIYGYQLSEIQNKPIVTLFNSGLAFNDASETDEIYNANIWNKTKRGNWLYKHLVVKRILDEKKRLQYYVGIYSEPVAGDPLLDQNSLSEYSTSLLAVTQIDQIGDYIDDMMYDTPDFMVIAIQMVGESRKLLETSQSVHGKFLMAGEEALKLELRYQMLAVPKTDMLIMVAPLETELSKDNGSFIQPEEKIVDEAIKDLDSFLRKLQITLGYTEIECKYITGVSISKVHAKKGKVLLQDALIALEALEKFKKTNYLVYDEKYYEYVKYHSTLKNELKMAFARHEFSVVFQPQYNTFSRDMYGVEALVRWKNQLLGNIPPTDFIPILEETDEILLLGKHVLNLIMNELSASDLPELPIRISVNLSSREFVNVEIIQELIRKIKSVDYPQLKWCFEITETTLVDNLDIANEIIQLLHEQDIEISIDDFGTGYSSLGYLKKLNADEIKIDRMFIGDYPERDNGNILKAIVAMGNEMGIKLIIEGVETEAQYEYIKLLQCGNYQGYFGSVPKSWTQIVAILQNKNN